MYCKLTQSDPCVSVMLNKGDNYHYDLLFSLDKNLPPLLVQYD